MFRSKKLIYREQTIEVQYYFIIQRNKLNSLGFRISFTFSLIFLSHKHQAKSSILNTTIVSPHPQQGKMCALFVAAEEVIIGQVA